MPEFALQPGGYAVHRRGSSPLRVLSIEGEEAVVRHLRFGYEITLPVGELRPISWEEASTLGRTKRRRRSELPDTESDTE